MSRLARQFWWGIGRCQGDYGLSSGVSGGEFRLKYDTFRQKVSYFFGKSIIHF